MFIRRQAGDVKEILQEIGRSLAWPFPWVALSCYLTTISLNCLIVCLVSDDIRENSSLNLNKFICDELQPNEEFHRLFNDAFNSLYRKLQTDLQDTEYATESTIHNLIKVGGQTAPLPSPEKWVVEKDAGKKCRCRCR